MDQELHSSFPLIGLGEGMYARAITSTHMLRLVLPFLLFSPATIVLEHSLNYILHIPKSTSLLPSLSLHNLLPPHLILTMKATVLVTMMFAALVAGEVSAADLPTCAVSLARPLPRLQPSSPPESAY